MKRPKKLSPLEQYRRDHDLSYQQLAALIHKQTGIHRDPKTIRKACEGNQGSLRVTTEHAIDKFLAAL